ncbi:MAG: hypothetical protein ABL921_21190 [Pirellula sp.]
MKNDDRLKRLNSVKGLALWMALLVPVVIAAMFGAQRARPDALGYFTTDGEAYITCSLAFQLDNVTLRTRYFDLATGRSISKQNQVAHGPRSNFVDVRLDQRQVTVLMQSTNARSVVFQSDVAEPGAVRTSNIQLRASDRKSGAMCISRNGVIQLSDRQLQFWDSATGVSRAPIPTISGPNTILHAFNDSSNFVSYDTSIKELTLYSTDAMEIQQLKRWTALDWFDFESESRHYIASLRPDGATYDVLEVQDGEIVATQSVPTRAPIPLAMFPTRSEYSFVYWRKIGRFTDVFTGETLGIPAAHKIIGEDRQRSRIASIGNSRTDPAHVAIFDKTIGREILRIPTLADVDSANFLPSTNEIAMATNDHRIMIHSLDSGRLLRTVDPFRFGFVFDCGACILFVIWLIGFQRFTHLDHWWGGTDSAVLFCLYAAYAIYRSRFVVGIGFDDFFLACMGVATAGPTLAVAMLFLERGRWMQRLSFVLLAFGVGTGVIVQLQQEPTATLVAPAYATILLSMISIILILRIFGLKLELVLPNEGDGELAASQSSRYSLRDAMFFMLVVGFVASILRWIPADHLYGVFFERSLLRELMSSIGFYAPLHAAMSVLAMWTCMSHLALAARWAPWLLGGVILGLMYNFHGVNASFALSSSLALVYGFQSYRMRGWRFRNKGVRYRLSDFGTVASSERREL